MSSTSLIRPQLINASCTGIFDEPASKRSRFWCPNTLSRSISGNRYEALGLLNVPVTSGHPRGHVNYDCFIRTAIQIWQCPLLCQKKGLEGILRHI